MLAEFDEKFTPSANGEPTATTEDDEHAKLARSIEDKPTSKSDDSDINESVPPPPALLPLDQNSREVTDTECGCIERYKLEEAEPANWSTLQGKN